MEPAMTKANRDPTRLKLPLHPDDMQDWVSIHEAVKRFLDEAKFDVRELPSKKEGDR
jgi:hypothetical protein